MVRFRMSMKDRPTNATGLISYYDGPTCASSEMDSATIDWSSLEISRTYKSGRGGRVKEAVLSNATRPPTGEASPDSNGVIRVLPS